VRSYLNELVSGRWFGCELSIFEWHSECNTIPNRYPVRQPLTIAVMQTTINNLNVFKSFQLMLAPSSTLLSNSVKFLRIHTYNFKYVLASPSLLTTCVIIVAL